jgi:hypothetical protein
MPIESALQEHKKIPTMAGAALDAPALQGGVFERWTSGQGGFARQRFFADRVRPKGYRLASDATA